MSSSIARDLLTLCGRKASGRKRAIRSKASAFIRASTSPMRRCPRRRPSKAMVRRRPRRSSAARSRSLPRHSALSPSSISSRRKTAPSHPSITSAANARTWRKARMSRSASRSACRRCSWKNTATASRKAPSIMPKAVSACALCWTILSAPREAVNALRLTVSQSRIPPPLADSPKCPRCALVTVCLPDEVRALAGSSLAPRPIAVPPDEALPLIVQSQRARISKEGEVLKITDEEQGETQVRLIDISDVALFGNVSITTPALATLLEREIPVSFHSYGGWFRGLAHGIGHRNVEVRTAQYRMSFDEAACLRFAKELVAAKIANQRTILRRNWRGPAEERQAVLDRLSAARRSAEGATRLTQLLGVEGDAASVYFRAFASLLKQPENKQGAEALAPFRFEARNRRPPTDPVNAMLSLAYAMLTRHLTIALASVGLDPYRGFYHAPRYGRPALALYLMEPFRPIIADSVVLSVVNTGEIGPNDFVVAVTGTALTQAGRRRFVEALERRLSQETTHPIFGYQLSMRRMLLVQARLLSRFLLGELPSYPHYLPR